MILKNVFRGDIIQCHGYNGGEILSYTLPSGNIRHRYGSYDQVVGRNVVLINVGDDMYIDLNDLSSHFGNSIGASIISVVAQGEDSYYVDKDSLKEYEYPYIPKEKLVAYGDSATYDSEVKLSKK